MLKTAELKNQIAQIKSEMKALQEQGKIDEAHDKIQLLNQVRKELAVAEEMEAEDVENTITNGSVKGTPKKDIDVNRVFNKLIMGKSVTEEEMEVYNLASTGQIEHSPEKGGYLVPEEQGKQLKEFRRYKVSLKELCNVVPVTTMTGKFPVAKDQKGKLIEFDELSEIGQTDLTFAQQEWSVKDYGDIIPVSNTLLEDTVFPLISIIGGNLTTKAVNTENEKILALLKTANTKVTGKDYKDISTILNKTLDPALANIAKIITNQSCFDHLDKLEDKNGHPLLTPDLTDPTKKLFKGKEIIVLTDEMLPQDAKKYPLYIGDVKEFVNFYDRKGVEIAQSTEAGFTKNATLLRAIERFDVKVVDQDAVVYLTIPEVAEA